MHSSRGIWIGFVISGLFFGLIVMSVVAAFTGSEVLSGIFKTVCHQFDYRCYHIDGVAMAVCVRCVWIYFGLAVGHTLFIYWKPKIKRITSALIGVLALMLFDVVLELLGVYHNWFLSRAVTGFLVGLTVSHFTLLGLQGLYLEFKNSKTYVRS